MTSYNPGPNLGGPDLSGGVTYPVRDIPSERPVDARPLSASDDSEVYTPIYARKPKSSASNKMMLFAIPVALVATGALVWATSGPKTADDAAATTELADARPVTTPSPAPNPPPRRLRPPARPRLRAVWRLRLNLAPPHRLQSNGFRPHRG